MPRLFSIRPGLSFKGRKFKGLRGWAGKPLHPPLTDIPIGAYILAAVFDVISYFVGPSEVGEDLFRAATWLLIAGIVASVPTIVTGFWDWWKSTPPRTQAWRTANWHMAVMLATTVIVAIEILMRLSGFDDVTATPTDLLLLSVLTALTVSFGAIYGGALVYDYEFNVEQDNGHAWAESETDVLPSTKGPGNPPT